MLLSRSDFPHLWKGRKGNGWVCRTLSSPSWDWGVPVIHESFASVFSPTPYNTVSFFSPTSWVFFSLWSSPLVCQCFFCVVDTQHRLPPVEHTWNPFRRQLWKCVILIFTHSIHVGSYYCRVHNWARLLMTPHTHTHTPSTACRAPSSTMHDTQQRRNFLISAN